MNFIKKIIKAAYYAYMSAIGCGCTVLLLLFLIPFVIGIGSAISDLEDFGFIRQTKAAHHESGMLMIDLATPIVEGPTNHDKLASFFSASPDGIGVCDLYDRILAAADDDNIKGIALYGSESYSPNSLAQISELRAMLAVFKETSNKPVFAYLENASQGDYYLASVATKIFMNPAGNIEFKGVKLKGMFIGNAMKKYGVKAELIRAGKYKSAGEIFTAEKFSDASRENYSEIAKAIWGNVLRDISTSRNIAKAELEDAANNRAFLDADNAKRLGFADEIATRQQFIEEMIKISGVDSETESFMQTELHDYMRESVKLNQMMHPRTAIAVLYMDGDIIEGSARLRGHVTADYYASIIRELRSDESIVGVVLRINSPGGSAYASEILREEIELLQKAKPVVAHFGASAASGAYWLSAGVNKIIAQENSITGSIGVFGLAFSGGDFANRFGITFDSVETSELADIMSGTRPMTEKERKIIEGLIDKTYADFINIVSKGRNMNKDEVEKIAQGKVWLASMAKNAKLVDETGTIADAIRECAAIAGAEPDIDYLEYPQAEKISDMILGMQSSPFVKIRNAIFPDALSSTLELIKTSSGIRAQNPHIISIEN